MNNTPKRKSLTFQKIIQKLSDYWSNIGCVIGQPYGMEVGAGTANPNTFFRALGPEPYNVAYVEPSRRPTDGRYGENPNRLQHYFQYQIIMKPAPENNIQLYIESLKQIGIDPTKHDLRFVEDNWESAPLGAWGLGWEVWLDGMEISQYTYFQQFAGSNLSLPCIEITLGLERLAMYIQGVDDYRKIMWNDRVTYGDLFERQEFLQSKFNFETAEIPALQTIYDNVEKIAKTEIVDNKNYSAGYDNLLRMSHFFNLLDSRGAVSLTDRTNKFKTMGILAREAGELYLKDRESLKYPLMNKAKLGTSAQTPIQRFHGVELKTHTYLLELGFEEFPAKYIEKWITQLGDNYAQQYFNKIQGFNFDNATLSFTPQRIVLQIDNPPAEIIAEKRIQGPQKTVCDQNPVILKKFIEKNTANTEFETLYETVNNKQIVVLKITEKITLNAFMQKFIDQLITTAPAAKFMRWDNVKANNFIRPLRWIFSYHDSTKVSVEALNVKASNHSYSPRYDIPIKAELESVSDYFAFIDNYKIILDQNERIAFIKKEIEDTTFTYSENIDEYIKLNAYLTEKPIIKWVELDKKYLKLPKEVITTVLEINQKYLIRQNIATGIISYGIVANGYKITDAIIAGNMKVATARLEDGLFYYNLDLKESSPNRESLKKITFHPDLETLHIDKSYAGKANRIEKLADSMYFHIKQNRDTAEYKFFVESLKHLKCAKATHIVKEFPSLEPVMSEHLALKHGINENVAELLKEHYFPTNSTSPLPKNQSARIISFADKLDTLVCLVLTNTLPQGSNDPYEARKNAYGLIELAFDTDNIGQFYDINDTKTGDGDYIHQAIYNYCITDEKEVKKFTKILLDYLNTRIYQLFKEQSENDSIIKGIAFSQTTNFRLKRDLFNSFVLLSNKDQPTLDNITDTFKRVSNILTKNKSAIPEKLQFDLSNNLILDETKLYEFDSKILHYSSIEQLTMLSDLLEAFFKNVTVMDTNISKRNNRLTLLQIIQNKVQEIFNYGFEK